MNYFLRKISRIKCFLKNVIYFLKEHLKWFKDYLKKELIIYI